MKVDFIRFKATDNVELQGWLSDTGGDTAAIHIHGMSGNGYENNFLDNLREMYVKNGISFFSIDNRGRGIISMFSQEGKIDEWGEGTKLAGSCFEIFEESEHDIQGAIDYLQSLGKTKFILQGHSLGCTKVVNYLVKHGNDDIVKALLLAPTDMTGWAETEPEHRNYLQKAKELNSEGKGKELVGAQCWLDKTPLSAQTYPTICDAGSSADIYGERDGGSLLSQVKVPILIPYGDIDIGITHVYKTFDKWRERVESYQNENILIAEIKGASHSYAGHETELAKVIEEFIKK